MTFHILYELDIVRLTMWTYYVCFPFSWVCLVGDLAYFPNGQSTMTGESIVNICYFLGTP